MDTITIDATNKKLGRVASEAARLIMGKNRADFVRHTFPSVTVVIENASKASISEKKRSSKKYENYSGYPGGRKELSMQQMIERKGYRSLFENAVFGMFPKNTLRRKMIKRLIVKE